MASEEFVAREEEAFQQEVAEIQQWWSSERFSHCKRPYTAQQVASLRGTVKAQYLSNLQAKKLWALLEEHRRNGTVTHTFGALDPVQVVIAAKYLSSVYVSGWQSSSTASTTNEPGPDLADYPMNTVPNKVDQLFRAQLFHDRKQREDRMAMSHEQRLKTPYVDYLRPIIADADTGHGGVGATAKLAKLFVEAGAAGIHIEDQSSTTKKCVPLDHQILTRHGFMDFCAVARHFESGFAELLVAAYEQYTSGNERFDRLVYVPVSAKDVVRNRASEMIELKYKTPGKTQLESIRVSPDHTVFAHYSLDGSHYSSAELKLEAQQLLTFQPDLTRSTVKRYRLVSTAASAEPLGDAAPGAVFTSTVLALEPLLGPVVATLLASATEGHANEARFLDSEAKTFSKDEEAEADVAAGRGVAEAPVSAEELATLPRVECATEPLAATPAMKLKAFFQLMGFFLANGSVAHKQLSSGAACLAESSPAAIAWLHSRLRILGVAYELRLCSSPGAALFVIADDALNRLLASELQPNLAADDALLQDAQYRANARLFGLINSGASTAVLSQTAQELKNSLRSLRLQPPSGAAQAGGQEPETRRDRPLATWMWLMPTAVKKWLIDGLVWARGDVQSWIHSGDVSVFAGSEGFRDQVVQLLMECGFSAFYERSQVAAGPKRALSSQWRVVGSRLATSVSMSKEDVARDAAGEDVWCVQLPRVHKIVVRAPAQDGKPCCTPVVVGNCGHMGGKVLVPIQEHISRLVACRLQFDIMGCETILISRTDAESAGLLTSNIDARDHPFILGSTNPAMPTLARLLDLADKQGKSPVELHRMEEDWLQQARLRTFPEAVADQLRELGKPVADWLKNSAHMSFEEAAAHAKELGVEPYWSWETPRTREGFYRVVESTEYCIARGLAFRPYSDLLWMETKKPVYEQARLFAQGVHAVFPGAKLCYNLSPSFNWDAAGMTDDQIRTFLWDIAKLGFCWQFITLAGFHCNAVAIDRFAADYAKRGMLAYVEQIQRQERQHGVETLAHQKWSGANYVDALLKAVTGASSTAAMGKKVTETQFSSHQ